MLEAASRPADDSNPARIGIFGLGNTLLGDDAVGPTVAQHLEQMTFPDDVVVSDLGTPGLDLTPYLLDLDAVLFIDAVALPEAPGTIRLLTRDEILAAEMTPRVSPHDPGVQQALQVVELMRDRPLQAWVLGVVPKQVELGAPLSAPVAAAVPQLARASLEWLDAQRPQNNPVENS